MSTATGTTPAEILIVEDDPTLASLVYTAVSVFVGARVHTAHSVREAHALVAAFAIDLAVIDVGLPDGSGLDVLRALRGGTPRDGVQSPVCVMHTVFDTDDVLFDALGAGADGYLLKGESTGMMAARLRAAMRGEPAISPSIARRVLQIVRDTTTGDAARTSAPRVDGAATVTLTPGELRVLRLIAQGATIAEVAGAIGVSVNTVKSQVKRVYERLDVHSRVAAAEKARRLGLLVDRE